MRKPNFLDNLPKDKLLHFAIGTVVFSGMSVLGSGMIIAIIATLIIGIGIEIYQKMTGAGAFEYMDAVAVWLGGAVVMLPQILDISKFL